MASKISKTIWGFSSEWSFLSFFRRLDKEGQVEMMILSLLILSGTFLTLLSVLTSFGFAVTVVAATAVAGLACYFIAREIRLRKGNTPTPVILVGHDPRTGKEILLNSDTARKHFLVVGGGDTNRSRYFTDLLGNSLYNGNGAVLVSSDPDRLLYHRVYESCVAAGREADLLLLNFSKQANVDYPHSAAKSHRFNPFHSADALSLANISRQMIWDLLDGERDDDVMLQARAVCLLTGLFRALTELRDSGGVRLTALTVVSHLDLNALVRLANFDDDPSGARLSEGARASVRAYLHCLAGFDGSRGELQRQSAIDDHERLRSRLAESFTALSSLLGETEQTGSGDIVLSDVIVRRRILLVILPDPGEDPHFWAGRFVVACLKTFAIPVLGSTIEATWDSLPSKARFFGRDTPFLVLLNGVENYFCNGMAIMAAQARALNMAMIFGVDHIGESWLTSKGGEMKSIISNTNSKIYLSGDEPLTVAMPYGPNDLSTAPGGRKLRSNEAALSSGSMLLKIDIRSFPQPLASFGSRLNHLISLSPIMPCDPGNSDASNAESVK